MRINLVNLKMFVVKISLKTFLNQKKNNVRLDILVVFKFFIIICAVMSIL